jgi:hypothetical protein
VQIDTSEEAFGGLLDSFVFKNQGLLLFEIIEDPASILPVDIEFTKASSSIGDVLNIQRENIVEARLFKDFGAKVHN